MCCVLGCSGCHNLRRLHDTFAGDGRAPVGGGAYCVEDEGRSEKLGSFHGVVGGAVVLCEIVAAVGGSGSPIVTELVLFVAVAEPPEPHVHGFGALG